MINQNNNQMKELNPNKKKYENINQNLSDSKHLNIGQKKKSIGLCNKSSNEII